MKKYACQDEQGETTKLMSLLKLEFGSVDKMDESLEPFLLQIKEHDGIPWPGEVPDSIKKAIFLAKTPDPLRTHIQLNTGAYVTFKEKRDTVHRFLRARKGLTSMGSGGKSKATEDDSMDADALYGVNAKKGKGKGKDGKGTSSKGKDKGKSKGKDGKHSKFVDGTCMNSQR